MESASFEEVEDVNPIAFFPPPPARKGSPPIAALDDLLVRFAPLAEEPEPVRSVRGVSLAVAQHWLIALPEGTFRDLALEQLADATDLACKAFN